MSQIRQKIEDSEYSIAGRIDENQVVLTDGTNFELYAKRNDFAGHVIVINDVGYEFVRTALAGDKWWAGINTQTRRFSLFDPFTFETAAEFAGKNVNVTTSDSGLTGNYDGLLTPIDKGKTQVGNIVLLNDCITAIRQTPA